MPSIDSRIVSLKFDNAQFEKGIRATSTTIGKFETLIGKLGVSTKDKLSQVGEAVGEVQSKFSLWGVVATGALLKIGSAAASLAGKLAHSVFVAPQTDGFAEYEQKIGSVQTILANTAKYGTTIDDVTKSLAALNEYSDKTIYNFSDMTRNIGLFTNAGIKLEDATSMIKGFSNSAAASGTNAQQAAGAAYQLSQALSAGTIRLMDWRSLTNAGMGSKNMQEGIIQIAKAMGTFVGSGTDATKATKDFNGSLEKGWLTADVMSTYLKIMAGDMDDAAMASIGLSAQQIENLKRQQQTAEEAATKIRTFTALVGTLKEELGSSWAETFELIFGNFEEATKLWSGLHDGIGKIINRIGDQRNAMLRSWKELGGRERLFEALSKAGNSLVAIFEALAKAWGEVFPPMTGKKLTGITDAFVKFIESVTPAPKTIQEIGKAFKLMLTPIKFLLKGLWVIITIGGKLAKPFISFAANVTASIFKSIDSVSAFIARMVDAIKHSYLFEKGVEGLRSVFHNIQTAIDSVKEAIHGFVGTIKNSVSGITSITDIGKLVSSAFDEVMRVAKARGLGFKDTLTLLGKTIRETFRKIFDLGGEDFSISDTANQLVSEYSDAFNSQMESLKDGAKSKWNSFAQIGSSTARVLVTAFEKITEALGNLSKSILKNADGPSLFAAVATVGAGALAKFVFDLGKIAKSFRADLLGPIGESIGALGGILEGFQKRLKAEALKTIATAIILLVGALFMLSLLDDASLAKGVTALASVIVMLSGALKLFSVAIKGMSPAQLTSLAASLTLIGAALLVFAISVKILGSMDFGELVKGISGIGGVLIVLAASLKLFSFAINSISSIKLVTLAVTISALGASMLLFATSIKLLSRIDWANLGKGLLGFASTLAIVAGFMHAVPSNPKAVFGIMGLSVAMIALAGAVRLFGSMKLGTIAKGLGAMAAALTILGVAVSVVGGIGVVSSVGLTLLVSSILLMAVAFRVISAIPWQNLAKSLGVMAAALLVFGGLAAILAPLLPVMSGLAIVMTLFGVAALAIGTGLVLVATSIAIFATALTALSATATVSAVAISSALFIMANGIADAFGQLVTRFIEIIPQVVTLLVELLDTILAKLAEKIPSITQSAVEIVSGFVVGLLTGLSAELPKMVNAAFDFMISFINTMSTVIVTRGPEVLGAIAGLAGQILRGLWNGIKNVGSVIADWVREIKNKITSFGSELWNSAKEAGKNIIDGIKNAITGGIGAIGSAMSSMASSAWNSFKSVLGINSPSKVMYSGGLFMIQGLTNGINDNAKMAEKATDNMGRRVSESVVSVIDEINSAFESDFDLEPTITPVLDMSNVRGGAAEMKSLLNDPLSVSRNSLAASANSFGRYQNGSVSSGNTQSISFVQNNYSPKALSRIDIYRQTNTQLSQLRSMTAVPA